jgi:hypothetical protein
VLATYRAEYKGGFGLLVRRRHRHGTTASRAVEVDAGGVDQDRGRLTIGRPSVNGRRAA